jgi:ABC-type Na+ efflux pump permease subunit
MTFFGPLLPLELARLPRRQRLTLIRCTYALGLTVLAGMIYGASTEWWTKVLAPSTTARITEGIFAGVFALQFFVAAIVTVNWMAGVITYEKERRTLPFLLATPLADREIIVGKLTARLAQVAMLLLAGLPVLCGLQFFGGVEPLAVLFGYAITAVTILSLGSLAVLCSVYTRTTRAAARRTSRIVAIYFFAWFAFNRLAPYLGPFPPVVDDIIDWLFAGNPFLITDHVYGTVRAGGRYADTLWEAVRNYLVFHAVAAVTFITWAALRLRPIAARQADGPPPPKRSGFRRLVPRPPIGDRPVLWKTLHVDFRQFRTAVSRGSAQAVFILSFLPLVVAFFIIGWFHDWQEVGTMMNFLFVRSLGTMVLCGVLVMIAANTAASIGRERRKQTLDELLLTDLTASEILGQKWWGSILVIRPALVWVASHWVIAVLCNGLHPLAIPLMMLEWSAYALFAASLGIYWAVRGRTTRESHVWTGVTGFLTAMLPVFASILVGMATSKGSDWFMVPAGASPPVALWLTGFRATDFAAVQKLTIPVGLLAVGPVVSVVGFALAGWLLWRAAVRRFPQALSRA